MNLLPIRFFTPEFVEELCLENIQGALLSFYIKTEGPTLRWGGRTIPHYLHLVSFGVYGVDDRGRRFTSNTPYFEITHHILSPVLNPLYSTKRVEGLEILRSKARSYLEEIEDSGEDMLSFVLSDIYNLYIYYLSIGTYPACEIFTEFLRYLNHSEIKLPSSNPTQYFDALFSYFKVFGFELSSIDDLEKTPEISKNLLTLFSQRDGKQ